MKISDIADELAKLDEPEPNDEAELEKLEAEDAAEKAEFEAFIMAHPEVTDEMVISSMREIVEGEVFDPVTIRAREECQKLGIGDYAPHRLNRTKPEVIPEEVAAELDKEMTWMHQVLEKRRAAQPPSRVPRPRPQQSWLRPQDRDYGGLNGEWNLGGGGYWR